MMASSHDVIVAGGGVAGLLTAALLADAGLGVCVLEPHVDRRPPTGDIGVRSYALTPAARAVLERIDAWRRLDHERVGWFARMEVWDAGSRGRIHFDPPPAHAGPMGWIVEHQNLVAALAAATERWAIAWRQTTFEHFEPGAPLTVVCGDGARLRAALLVGADGASSRVRDAAGISVDRHPYRQRALACNVVTAQAHGHVARQRFLASGPLAFLPLPDPHRCAIVWSCDDALADRLAATDDERFRAELEIAFEHALGAIEEVGPRAWFPLERARAAATVAGNCVLVGDAAHVVHPLAGQGLNLGILDVAALRECLGRRDLRKTWPPAAGLRRYERWRKSEALALLLVTDGLQRLFQRDERALRVLRGAGMRLTEHMPAVKQWLIGRAMGLGGDLPAIARSAPGTGGE